MLDKVENEEDFDNINLDDLDPEDVEKMLDNIIESNDKTLE